MRLLPGGTTLLFCLLSVTVYAQHAASLQHKLTMFPNKLLKNVESKANHLQQRFNMQTERYISKLIQQEKRLKKKLAKTNVALADSLFGDIDAKYCALTATSTQNISNYIGNIDSVNTSLAFLQQQLFSKESPPQLQQALDAYRQLLNTDAKAKEIQEYLNKRQAYLKEQLMQSGMIKGFKQFQKEVYYYNAQVEEYRNLLADPSRLEKKLLQLVKKIPAFTEFFKKNSQLASLFSIPDDYGSTASLQGLQTRAGVQALIDQRIAAGGPGAQQLVSQNIAAAQSQLQQFRNKIRRLRTGGSKETDIPGFKPNGQRTKTFLQRLEYGTNIQTQKAQQYFPATTEVALSVGYKLNDKSIIGLGASYKVGLGRGWNDIKLSHQGIGIRSFIDCKLKGSFFITGGYEQNYRAEFKRISQLQNNNAWQQSGLLGISKKYSISSVIRSKKPINGNLQLLYDFLHAQQIPKTQPVIFRLGYNF